MYKTPTIAGSGEGLMYVRNLIPASREANFFFLKKKLMFVLMSYAWSSVQALEVFRKQQVDFLIATDVAARVR